MLYRYSAVVGMVVEAGSPQEAKHIGYSYAKGSGGFDVVNQSAHRVCEDAEVPDGWMDAVPFGTGELTVRQRLHPEVKAVEVFVDKRPTTFEVEDDCG